ncbi:gliding motility-associated C-terminal domain-containing protein [bacterium]|nr:gliding motility-associated C-terminal domain-containing protein [bacterium]
MMKFPFSILIQLFSLLIILVQGTSSFAQFEYSHWYFGDEAGLDFRTDPPTVLNNGKIVTDEGSASICDSLGNLLFYTDGITIWNADHDTLLNGSQLDGHTSSFQSALILKQPGSDSLYYIFTTGLIGSGTVSYTIVDLSLDNGRGGVTSKNNVLLNNSGETITACYHSNKEDIWILTRQYPATDLYAYRLTSSGLALSPVVSTLSAQYLFGALRISNDATNLMSRGSKLVNGNFKQLVFCWDFDPSSGTISNEKTWYSDGSILDVLSSSNDRFLYLIETDLGNTGKRKLTQYEIEQLQNPVIYIDTLGFDLVTNTTHSRMEMGLDGRIYILDVNSPSFLSVVGAPNLPEMEADYKSNHIDLSPNEAIRGLPHFNINNFVFNPKWRIEGRCLDDIRVSIINHALDSLQLFVDSTYHSTYFDSTFTPDNIPSGNYKLTAKVYFKGAYRFLSDSLIIHQPPILDLGPDSLLCNNETLYRDFTGLGLDSLLWSDGNRDSLREINSDGLYHVTVFKNSCTTTDSVKSLFINCSIKDSLLCEGDQTILRLEEERIDSVFWDTKDGNVFITWGSELQYQFSSHGFYELDLTVYKEGLQRNIKHNIEIRKQPRPVLPEDTIICEKFQLSPQVDSSFYIFQWLDGSEPWSRVITSSGQYILVLDSSGCSVKDTINLSIENCICELFVPSAFSPNYDGINDSFSVYSDCDFERYELILFNRWGEKMLTYYSPSVKWSGEYKGAMCQSGYYVYTLTTKKKGEEIKFKKGIIYLLE